MKVLFFITFVMVLDLIAAHNKKHHQIVKTCLPRECGDYYEPVCGKQKQIDCWDVKIFKNACLMESANDCGRANYVPCVKHVCEAGGRVSDESA